MTDLDTAQHDGGAPSDLPTQPTTKTPKLSRLGQLQTRREEVLERQRLDRRVPRWSDPEIWIRYKPIDHGIISEGFRRVDNAPAAKKSAVELAINADLLIRACVAVYAKLDGEDTEYSLRPDDPEGELTRFDPDLARNLGMPDNSTARQVVTKLFITDGDVLAHAKAVAEFSGYREEEADDDILGE